MGTVARRPAAGAGAGGECLDAACGRGVTRVSPGMGELACPLSVPGFQASGTEMTRTAPGPDGA